MKAHERFSSSVSVRNYALEDCDEYPTLRDSIPMHKTFLDRSPKEEIPDEDTIRAILPRLAKRPRGRAQLRILRISDLSCQGDCRFPGQGRAGDVRGRL